MSDRFKAPVRRVGRRFVHSSAGAATARATAPFYARTPVRQLPAWYGALQQIRVPRGVVAAPDPTPASQANVTVVLDLLDATEGVKGDVAECGVFRGATLLAMALHLERSASGRRVFGFDSFEGFDDRIDRDLAFGGAPDQHKRRGGFSGTSIDEVADRAVRLGVSERVTLEAGWFPQSLEAVREERFSFVHLDCDLYESYRDCLEFFYPRMSRGGIVLLDEYDDPPWPGCNRAVDEFLADRAETLTQIRRDNHIKYCFSRE